jgi:carboxymethylenebutenolidase
VSAYDEDATLAVDHLLSIKTCTGRIGTAGMCLGGHLALRCAFDKRVHAGVCYFATDIHGGTLGNGGDDSLKRMANEEITGELIMVGLFAN